MSTSNDGSPLRGVYLVVLLVFTVAGIYHVAWVEWPPSFWDLAGYALLWTGHLLWLHETAQRDARR